MSDYTDLEIIKLRQESKKLEQLVFLNKATINDEEYTFEDVDLFDDALIISLPTSFFIMDERTTKKKYPMEMRPQIIYTNSEGTINFTFTLADNLIEKDKSLEDALSEMRVVLKRIHPTTRFVEKKVFENIQKTKVGQMDCIIPALDADIYHLYFLLRIKEKVVLGIFNCDSQDYREWKKVLIKIVDMIRINETIEVDNNEN